LSQYRDAQDRFGVDMIRRVGIVLLCHWLLLGTAALASTSDSEEPEPSLRFSRTSGGMRTLQLSQLRESCPEETVEVADPYHKRRMSYLALPLRCVLDLAFEDAGGAEGQRSRSLLLRALDGYTRPVSGRDLLEPGVYLAFGEPGLMKAPSSRPTFSKIDRRRVDPGPFYMVWIGAGQSDPHVHPWPYQLATIEIAPFAEAFPKTVPTGLPTRDRGWAGYALFQRSCASCHSINGEGGKVGPDLNVPRSIVEYRPVAQIRAYIRDPQLTRYTSMPAHPNLDESDLDALIAYLQAMSQRKDDPGSRAGS
jgi:mono/diheme cytochrome c family protein